MEEVELEKGWNDVKQFPPPPDGWCLYISIVIGNIPGNTLLGNTLEHGQLGITVKQGDSSTGEHWGRTNNVGHHWLHSGESRRENKENTRVSSCVRILSVIYKLLRGGRVSVSFEMDRIVFHLDISHQIEQSRTEIEYLSYLSCALSHRGNSSRICH